ncbi:hypothetical protein BGZ51_004077 [Haplosporangium sp. Z 767]|nr:hypothetical protein BGZ50_007231 [Haplosporangium sp. Z 11]KAF9183344.1 hypothetical protein BGZ51_004077 [Haplosporangium sp. Z 767]
MTNNANNHNNEGGILEIASDVPIILPRNVLGSFDSMTQDNNLGKEIEEDIDMEGELKQLPRSGADGASNSSNASPGVSDEKILDYLYQEKERLALRKRHAARLLALSSSQQINNEKAYLEAKQQLDEINVKINRLEDSMKDVASSKQSRSNDRKNQPGNESNETRSGEQGRIAQFKQLLEIRRMEKESYRQFAMRIARDIRICGIKDDNELVLSLLSATVNPETFNLMVTRLHILKRKEATFTSIADFTKVMSGLTGPEDASHPNVNQAITPSENTNGPQRHHSHGQNRFSPKNRPQESNKNEQHVSNRNNTRSGGQFYCVLCKSNPTHNTLECKKCTLCQKMGHVYDECRLKKKPPGE